jgi:hypothetical protein
MFTTPHTNTTNFSTNHNGKLLLYNFPTVRLHNSTKYYATAKHLIQLNNTPLGIAEIKVVRQFSFNRINDVLTMVDAAMTADKFKGMLHKMYGSKTNINENTQLDHIVYHWVERHIENQTILLNNYWTRIVEEEKQELQAQTQLNFLNQ